MKQFSKAVCAAVVLLASTGALAQDFADYAHDAEIQFWFRTGTPTKPTTLAYALGTACAADGTLTELTNANGYARVALNPLDTNYAAASTGGGGRQTSNSAAVTFAAATGSAWAGGGNVSHFAIYTSATYGSGSPVLCKSLTTAKPVAVGDTASFPIGSVVITKQ